MSTRELIEEYYDCWVRGDRARTRELLADDLRFRSPEDEFDDADSFLDACWQLSEGFDEMHVEHGLYSDNGAYVVYRTGEFCCGELLMVRGGRIHEILVTFNPTI